MNEMIRTVSDLPYFKITYKNGIQNPVTLNAIDYADAKKRGFAHHLKNSDIEYSQKYDIDNYIESVVAI